MAAILIIDDHHDTRDLLRRVFASWGYETYAAETGEAGLALLSSSKTKPDLIIVDGMMPGMTGIDFLLLLRSHPDTANIPAVLYTAIGDQSFAKNAITHGATEVWRNGEIELEKMQERIRALIGRGG